jgi:hypothetical protein
MIYHHLLHIINRYPCIDAVYLTRTNHTYQVEYIGEYSDENTNAHKFNSIIIPDNLLLMMKKQPQITDITRCGLDSPKRRCYLGISAKRRHVPCIKLGRRIHVFLAAVTFDGKRPRQRRNLTTGNGGQLV